jgi:hypothetical protein
MTARRRSGQPKTTARTWEEFEEELFYVPPTEAELAHLARIQYLTSKERAMEQFEVIKENWSHLKLKDTAPREILISEEDAIRLAIERLSYMFPPDRIKTVIERTAYIFGGRRAIDLIQEGRMEDVIEGYERTFDYANNLSVQTELV